MPTSRPSPTREQLERYAAHFNKSRSLNYFKLKLTFPELDLVRVELPVVADEHRGGLGTTAVNGGVLAAIFDLAIGCTPALLDPRRRSATVQLSMSFEQAVMGDSLVAEARVDKAGSSTLFSSARILDSRGVVCARCQGVVRMSKESWASDSPAIN
jgi:uncharacterized protein (TIGR00369 family)